MIKRALPCDTHRVPQCLYGDDTYPSCSGCPESVTVWCPHVTCCHGGHCFGCPDMKVVIYPAK